MLKGQYLFVKSNFVTKLLVHYCNIENMNIENMNNFEMKNY